MESIVDLIATDGNQAKVADDLKDQLYTKAAEKIETLRSGVANSMFNPSESEPESQPEVEQDTGEE